ncbi:hypothetical protein HY486_01260 [Candidatus Woesearchaeota archaeon]|nr:hypothetical protein [Candidatus Woesearchaeota archaeon]
MIGLYQQMQGLYEKVVEASKRNDEQGVESGLRNLLGFVKIHDFDLLKMDFRAYLLGRALPSKNEEGFLEKAVDVCRSYSVTKVIEGVVTALQAEGVYTKEYAAGLNLIEEGISEGIGACKRRRLVPVSVPTSFLPRSVGSSNIVAV